MRKVILLTFLLMCVTVVNSQVIKFKGTYKEALAEAKKTNKMLMFMGSTTW